jgi:integrase
MPKKRLTEEGVTKLKPPAAGKQLDYFDAGMPGLVLRVNYGGAKVWRALYYVKKVDKDGKRITMPTTRKLGRYPHIKLKEAREKARQFLADPQKALTQADDGSFREVAENFIKRHVEHEQLRTQLEIERVLTKYIYPKWEHRPFREIKRSDVATLLDQIVDDNGPRQADVCLAVIRKMMNWYASRNDDYVSPIVQGMNRSTNGKRERILAKTKTNKDGDDELRALWKATDDQGTFGALLKVALLTAQRKDKVATMRWDDIVDGVWQIASEEREKSNAGSLLLPQAVIDIIEAQPRIAGNPFVFAAGKGNGPFNSFSQRKEELDAKLPPRMPDWRIHDLRRTAKTLMARAGVLPHVSEQVLGHTIKGVEGVYDQHDYGPEKAQALLQLAALVGQIINPPPKAKVDQRDEHRRKRRRA